MNVLNDKITRFSYILLLSLLIIPVLVVGQKTQYDIACVGFYNVENLFDTEDDPIKNDAQYLPNGSNNWTLDRYEEKVGNMAKVISLMGREKTKEGVTVLGVSEIENRKVLEDLVAHPKLKARNYGIVHYESPDNRGIDVGLLYQKSKFEVRDSRAINLKLLKPDGELLKTRDILLVSGKLNGEEMHFLVNHWPSRRGGESRSAGFRQAAARANKAVVDSITKVNSAAKVIIMGDLNDDPTSESLTDHLKAESNKKKLKKPNDLYNTMYSYYKKGVGSNAYRDAWSLFDQIIISKNLVDKKQEGYFHFQTEIFNKDFLTQRAGRYKGYPFRTFSFGKYIGGYSDHFPVFVYLIKESSKTSN